LLKKEACHHPDDTLQHEKTIFLSNYYSNKLYSEIFK